MWPEGVAGVMLGRRVPGSDTDTRERGRRVRRAAFAAAVLVSVVVLFAPADDVPSGLPPGTDKVVHAALFALLALTGRRAGVRPRVLVPVLLGYAVLSEVVQGAALPGRSARGA